MAWDKGFNFRTTSGFVTDGLNETYVIAEAYPTTRNGVTFGFTDIIDSRDRDAGADRRLAGINFRSNGDGAQTPFRIDLTAAGDYQINAALGDAGGSQTEYLQIYDNTSLLATISGIATGGAEYVDAGGTVRTAAAWPGSNAPITKTFATTIALFKIAALIPDAGASTPAHLFLSQVAVVGGVNRSLQCETGVYRSFA